MSASLLHGLRPPLPHQRKPIGFVAGRDHPAIFMDKRLGKCMVAIRHAIWHDVKWVLIVAPVSACPGWLDELKADGQIGIPLYGTFEQREATFESAFQEHRFGAQTIFFVINPEGLFKAKGRGPKLVCPECGGVGTTDHAISDIDIPCTTCAGSGQVRNERALPTVSAIALFPWHEVIWDESTNLRNTKSQVHQVACTSFYDTPHRCILSGEYAPEGPQDVFGQMKFLLGGRFMGHTNFFAWRDANFERVGYDWLPRKGHMTLIRKAVEAHAVILSRKSAGLGDVRSFERVAVELPKELRRVYDHAEKYFELPPEYQGEEDTAASGVTTHAVVVRNWLAQLAGGHPKHFPKLLSDHKTAAITKLVTERFRREPLVLTFRYNAELFAAMAACQAEGVACASITGTVTPETRRVLQHAFKEREIRALFLQCRVARFGIDLSAASTMIRGSLPDPYEDISQPMDRIVHPMKREPLAYIDIVTNDTVDEDKFMAMQEKNVTARSFMRRTDELFEARRARKFGKDRNRG